MLKLLKWDFRNFLAKYGWFYISFLLTFLLIIIFPSSLKPYSSIVYGLAAIYSLFFLGYTFLLSLSIPISWLRVSSSSLELSLPIKPWQILLSKISLAICVNLSGYILTKILWMAINQFGMSHIVLFKGLSSWLQYGIGMTTLIVVWMFAYILAKSFRFTRSKAKVSTALFSVTICALFVWFLAELFIHTGTWNLSLANPGGISISPDKKIEWLVTLTTMIGSLLIITFGFFGSCKLLEHRFERY